MSTDPNSPAASSRKTESRKLSADSSLMLSLLEQAIEDHTWDHVLQKMILAFRETAGIPLAACLVTGDTFGWSTVCSQAGLPSREWEQVEAGLAEAYLSETGHPAPQAIQRSRQVSRQPETLQPEQGSHTQVIPLPRSDWFHGVLLSFGSAGNKEGVTDLMQETAHQLAVLLTAKQAIETEALTEPLTGLQNLRAFEPALASLMASTRAFTLLILDVDNLKAINDTFGHAAGDAVLTSFSDLLRSITRHSDKIFRLGGDEFALLLPDTTAEQALGVAQRLGHHIRTHQFSPLPDSTSVHASIGLAAYPPNAPRIRPAELRERADQALYHVKRTGKDSFAFWHHLPELSKKSPATP